MIDKLPKKMLLKIFKFFSIACLFLMILVSGFFFRLYYSPISLNVFQPIFKKQLKDLTSDY